MDLTAAELLTFGKMAQELSEVLGKMIHYESPDLWRFFRAKQKEGTPVGYIFILILLHYFPRFQKKPPLSDNIRRVLGRDPITFRQFAQDYVGKLI